MKVSCLGFGLIFIPLWIHAQDARDPFTGGIEIGYGYGTVMDFNLDNNHLYKDFLLERLFDQPYHLGVESAKYLGPNRSVEFGVFYDRKGAAFVVHHVYADPNLRGATAHSLSLHCIDLPVKYCTYVGTWGDSPVNAYGGLVPSWLMVPVEHNNSADIPEECFRNFFLSVCGGLCVGRKRSRMKLHSGLAVMSVVNSNYREIPEEDRDYGNRIYPFEMMFCYERLFR